MLYNFKANIWHQRALKRCYYFKKHPTNGCNHAIVCKAISRGENTKILANLVNLLCLRTVVPRACYQPNLSTIGGLSKAEEVPFPQ